MIRTWEQFLLEREEYEFSSTQINLPKKLAEKIKSWAERIPEEELSGKGLENEPHVTVLFGLHTNEPDEIIDLTNNTGVINIELGKMSHFKAPEFDVLKIEVKSDDLVKLNKKLRQNVKYSSDHPSYIPHCTVAYLKKGFVEKYDGNKEFDGTKVEIDTLLFSNKNRNKTPIDLNNA